MKSVLRITAALAASLSMGAATAASAAQPVCLSKPEARSLLTYALPQVISGTGKRCSAVLPADSYLRQHGNELAARYGTQKARYWPEAKAAFLRISTAKDPQLGQFTRNLPDGSMQQLVDVTVEGMVSQNVKLESCDDIDLAIDLLSPLPPENTAGLIALFVEIGAEAAQSPERSPSVGGFTICEN